MVKHACVIAARCTAMRRNCGRSERAKKFARTTDKANVARMGGARPCSRNHPRRSRAHNLPIGTLHYSCLQLQPANQPGAPRRVQPRRDASYSLPPHLRATAAPPQKPAALRAVRAPLFASVKFSCSPRGGFELTINFGRTRRSFPFGTAPVSGRPRRFRSVTNKI